MFQARVVEKIKAHILLAIIFFFRKSCCFRGNVEIYCRVGGRGEGCTGFWWGNLRERDHWGNPDADGRIILRWIFRKWEGVVGTGWSWLRIGTGGGHL